MYSILNLLYRTEQLANHIAGVGESGPSDFADFFWARQHGYACLGLEVSGVIRRLRECAGLPIESPIKGEWNRDEQLKGQRNKIDSERAEYDVRLAAGVSQFAYQNA